MKAGDVVLYSIAGQTHNALVLQAHSGQPQLLGKNGEPLLHLAFIAPERESAIQRAKFGYIPQVFTEFDVVHCSQEFSDEQKKALGIQSPAQLAQQRGQGEWREVSLINWNGAVAPLSDEEVCALLESGMKRIAAGETIPFAAAPPAPPLHDVPQNDSPVDVFAQPEDTPPVSDPNPTQE